MNFLSHAYRYLDRPYFAAGTGIPDWMNVVDRRNRTRRQSVQPYLRDEDRIVAEVAAGCYQHHEDDRVFHQSPVFVRLNAQLANDVRDLLGSDMEGGDMGHQAGFLGHIAIELVLDWVLCQREPTILDRYYGVLGGTDSLQVQRATNLFCKAPVTGLAPLIDRFVAARFIEDYAQDESLIRRLDGVMRRVGLPQLPTELVQWLPTVRSVVNEHADELLDVPLHTSSR